MNKHQLDLLNEVALCLVGILREQYAANDLRIEHRPEENATLKAINDELMNRMVKIVVLIGAATSKVYIEDIKRFEPSCRAQLMETIAQMKADVKDKDS